MVKDTQIIRQQQLTNCLSVFDHFAGLVLKGLRNMTKKHLILKEIVYLIFDIKLLFYVGFSRKHKEIFSRIFHFFEYIFTKNCLEMENNQQKSKMQ